MTATCAIIPASGLGERLTSFSGKTFVPVAGRPLISHALSAFEDCQAIDAVILVVRAGDVISAETLVRDGGFSKVLPIVTGGKERQDSVRNGLAALPSHCDIVVIHDGARPLVTSEMINASIKAADEFGAAVVAVPVIDTVKTSIDGRFVNSTVDRRSLCAVQTPQTFRVPLIRAAYERAYEDGYLGTDDSSLVERLGLPVSIVRGDYENLKITTPPDLVLAEAIMKSRDTMPSSMDTDIDVTAIWRVGHGYDVHRFAEGRRLILGGVEFPGTDGLLGHSDADVLLHAVADSLLGAAGAGDIGLHFPDTDPEYKDADSLLLLRRVGDLIKKRGWRVSNVDVTLIAQRPRIAGHTPQMRENISCALGIATESVNVKATTAEGLGPIGEGLGIECHAVSMLLPR